MVGNFPPLKQWGQGISTKSSEGTSMTFRLFKDAGQSIFKEFTLNYLGYTDDHVPFELPYKNLHGKDIDSQHVIFDKFSNETNAKIEVARVHMYTCAIIEMMNTHLIGFHCAFYGKGSCLKILMDRAYHLACENYLQAHGHPPSFLYSTFLMPQMIAVIHRHCRESLFCDLDAGVTFIFAGMEGISELFLLSRDQL